MIESQLKRIASELGGEYSIQYYKISFTDGSRNPETHHKIDYKYSESEISILVQTGFTETARVVATLAANTVPIEFEINSISPFENLFLRRKTRFKIKCKKQNFKYFLESKALLIFDHTMKTKNFNPRIFTQVNEFKNQIIFEFHLGFPEWYNAFEEINQCLKSIIDALNANNEFTSTDTNSINH